MKILIFTEGTLIMHPSGAQVSRGERVIQVKQNLREIKEFKNYIPVGNAVRKLHIWQNRGAKICYLTSRESNDEIMDIQNVLDRNSFPNGELYFRRPGEDYKDVAERVVPDILIEDDCESIGGESEMTYPHIRPEVRQKIKSVVVKEFSGIDKLASNPKDL